MQRRWLHHALLSVALLLGLFSPHSAPQTWAQATPTPGTVILHSRADDVVPFAFSEGLVRNSGLPASALVEVGSDHWLSHPDALAAMLAACEGRPPERPLEDGAK